MSLAGRSTGRVGDFGLGLTNAGEALDGVFLSAAGFTAGGGVVDGFEVGWVGWVGLPVDFSCDEDAYDFREVAAGFDVFGLSAPFRAVVTPGPSLGPELPLVLPLEPGPLLLWTPMGSLPPSF